ncbi:MAG: hypothetical protein AB4060_00100, partial [Crocosphaera sp.]
VIHRYKPFEDMFQIVGFYSINHKGKQIGATILKKAKKESYRVVFGFECGGISPLQSEEEFASCLARLETGLKDLPKGEILTIHFGTFRDDLKRQQELGELTNLNPELALLIGGTRKRVQDLTNEGIRKISFLRFYLTYTMEQGQEKKADWAEKTLSAIEGYWLMFTGQYGEHQKQKVETILKLAYIDGYQRAEELFSDQLKLGVRAKSDQEMRDDLWSRFNSTNPRKLPYRIIFDGKTFTEEVNSDVDFMSYLMESESSVPVAKKKSVYVNNRHTGVLYLADKPDGWIDEGDQLRSLWEVLAKDRVYDTEVFCQLQLGNSRLMREKLKSLTKQSNVAASTAAEKNDVDVGAQLKAEETIEAQASLIRGNVPLHTAVVVLIHRNHEQELDNACSNFIASFPRQGWCVRETEYAWRVWVETFPQLTWDKLLTKPFKRLQSYQTSEVPGVMPLCKTPLIDHKGIEFISQEGGNPVYLDLFNSQRHLGYFATQRSGKSLSNCELFALALAHNIPVTVLEFPKGDGTGTFSDFCHFLSPYCSYLDTGSSILGFNCVEPPDLSGRKGKDQVELLGDFKEYLKQLLFLLVFGGKENNSQEIDPSRVSSLFDLMIARFYGNNQIINRFAKAYQQGQGTAAWDSMPVLWDLLMFCSPERLELVDADTATIKALKYIKLRLLAWKETKIGQILSRPTTFDSNKLMQVVALRNLGNNLDAAVMAMMFNLFAARRSLSYEKSIIFADEAPILFQWDSLAMAIGQHFAASGKSGIRVIICAQEPSSIGRSIAADMIFANMTTRIIGRIQRGAIPAYEQWMGYPSQLLEPLVNYGINKKGRYSQWLLDDSGIYVPVRFYPSDILISLAANNAEESALRRKYFSNSEDKVRALVDFSKAYLKAA